MINSARKLKIIIFTLIVWKCSISDVSAQLLDDIILNKTKDGKVVAIIALSGQVQYIRHFPEKQGQHLEIDFKILSEGSPNDPWQGYEARTSPPSDLIPRFVVAVRDITTEPKLVIDFNGVTQYSVQLGKNARSFVITIQLGNAPKIEGEAAPIIVNEIQSTKIEVSATNLEIKAASNVPPDVASNKEADIQAEAFMLKGREALKLNENGLAIEAFNKVLKLPPNKYSQDAQEWVGIARENAGQKFKAKLEYESYLKMYSNGDGVARVKERLAKLSAVQQPVQVAQKIESPKEMKEFQTIRNGSLSMNYYHGESITSVAGSPTPSSPLTDQSMLITNINASQRWRNDRYDNRIVFQDTYNKNYLAQSGQTNPNRLSTAYYDFKDSMTTLLIRPNEI